MKIRNFLILTGILIFSFSHSIAQTKVIKKSATKSTDYGVEYFLPKTVLIISTDYSKITQKAGPYAKYAERYLGVKKEEVIMEDQVFYRLDNVKVEGEGVPDKSESYLIEFKSKTTAPFVYLTEDGMICTINADYELPAPTIQKGATTSENTSLTVDPKSIFTEEYLMAGSVSKMAEVAAKQIYKLRESRTDLLTGEAENAPRDGEGMKIVLANLEAQEKGLVELFLGTSTTETKKAVFETEPQSDLNKEVIFRFSKYGGVVDADDLSGSPVYINVRNLETTEETVADPKRKEKEAKSIVYNLPGKAAVEIYYGEKSMYKNDIQIVQFGNKEILATSLFDDKKSPVKIYFYPNTGSIKQIIQ